MEITERGFQSVCISISAQIYIFCGLIRGQKLRHKKGIQLNKYIKGKTVIQYIQTGGLPGRLFWSDC